jgi:hypothetical protein
VFKRLVRSRKHLSDHPALARSSYLVAWPDRNASTMYQLFLPPTKAAERSVALTHSTSLAQHARHVRRCAALVPQASVARGLTSISSNVVPNGPSPWATGGLRGRTFCRWWRLPLAAAACHATGHCSPKASHTVLIRLETSARTTLALRVPE